MTVSPRNAVSGVAEPVPRSVPPFSVLDLAFVSEGSDAASALHHSRDLAQHVEQWGYERFWLAEHHNAPGVASAATAVVISHVAAGTERIRVGAGGVMLPNHAPLVIAEQFGTLETLYSGRIDLGLGRAPGTDQLTVRALRRSGSSADTFPQDVQELRDLLGPARPGQAVEAVPGTGTRVPLWILGSSLFGAQLAAALGLPFAFASHFAPDALLPALQVYRSEFRPSGQLRQPYAMVGVNVLAADEGAEAHRLFTSHQRFMAATLRGGRGLFPPPVDDIDDHWSATEKAYVSRMLRRSFVGSAESVRDGLEEFIEETGADELIVSSPSFHHAERVRSYEILADVREALVRARATPSPAESSP
jgi:luciferase family oxidoreductase group 1